jgi:peptidoglycan/xylan/chitin deacetylase (PgdA/CDA1 family)
MTHPSATFWALPKKRIASEIDRCSDAIEKATGSKPSLFRAPVGMKNPFVHPLLDARGLRLIGWSARGFDGVRSMPEDAALRIMKSVRPGAIILAHEGRVRE